MGFENKTAQYLFILHDFKISELLTPFGHSTIASLKLLSLWSNIMELRLFYLLTPF